MAGHVFGSRRIWIIRCVFGRHLFSIDCSDAQSRIALAVFGLLRPFIVFVIRFLCGGHVVRTSIDFGVAGVIILLGLYYFDVLVYLIVLGLVLILLWGTAFLF